MIFSVMFIAAIKFLRLLLFNKLLINIKTSLESGQDRDSQVNRGGMVGFTGKNAGEKAGSENPTEDPLKRTKLKILASISYYVEEA